MISGVHFNISDSAILVRTILTDCRIAKIDHFKSDGKANLMYANILLASSFEFMLMQIFNLTGKVPLK